VARPAKVDEAQLTDLYDQVPDVGCKGLCTYSCGSIGMDPLEQRRVAQLGVDLPLFAVFPVLCPALDAGRCSVYEVRPMVCRLWGAVEDMRCPCGCAPPDGHLTRPEALRLLGRVSVISRRVLAQEATP
jgi:hypothetical protein